MLDMERGEGAMLDMGGGGGGGGGGGAMLDIGREEKEGSMCPRFLHLHVHVYFLINIL